MPESPRNPKTRSFLRSALVAVPLAVLFSAGFLHAQHALDHGHSAPAQLIGSDHVHTMLARVGASEAQQLRINELIAAANDQMQAAHKGLGDAHGQLAALLLAPAVDRGQLEALRASQIAALDTASRHMLAAIEDAVNELTPEQRAKLADMHQPHGG